MASSLISKIKIHRQLGSVDLNSNPSPKPIESHSLFQLVKLKQRRLTSNQISKQTEIKGDPSSGLSKGYPSTENTGVPSESGQGKSSTVQSPFLQRNRKSISHLETAQKQQKNYGETGQKNHSRDPFELFRPDSDLKFEFSEGLAQLDAIRPVTNPFIEGTNFFERSLHLSLSAIKNELETDQFKRRQEFFEVSTVINHSFNVNICAKPKKNSPNDEFGIFEEDPIPQGFLKVDVSRIQKRDIVPKAGLEDSMEALFASDNILNLSLSAVNSFQEKNISSIEMIDNFSAPDVNISVIEVENKPEDESDLNVIHALVLLDFSLNIKLSAVEQENSMNSKSDRETLEVLLEL